MRKKLNELSNLEYFSNRINWCGQRYKYISRGSARKVFHYSETLVIKVAYNEKGIAQNQAEVDIWNYTFPNQRKVLAAVIDYCPNYTWVLQRKITKKCTDKQVTHFYRTKSTILKSLTSLDLNHGDTSRSLGSSRKGIVIYDYGFTNFVNRNYYQ